MARAHIKQKIISTHSRALARRQSGLFRAFIKGVFRLFSNCWSARGNFLIKIVQQKLVQILKSGQVFIKAKIRSSQRHLPPKIQKLLNRRRREAWLQQAASFLLLGVVVFSHLFSGQSVYATTYTFTQLSWSGGASGLSALHPDDQSSWNRFASKDAGIAVINGGSALQLATSTSAVVQTDEGSTNTGFNLSGANFSDTTITGSGSSASVQITSNNSYFDTRTNYSVGTSPITPVFDSFTNSIWVTNYGSNTVTKLNPADGSVRGTYAVGTNPSGAAFDSSTNSIWVANYGSGNVTKLNAANGAVIGTYAVGTWPRGVTFDPSTNSIWVANYASNTVTKLRASDGVVSGTYAAGTSPDGITFDSYTNSVWVVNRGAGNVMKINPADGSVLGTYSVGSSPRGVTFDSTSNSIWVAGWGSDSIKKLSAVDGTLLGTYNTGGNTGPEGIVFDAASNVIWTSTQRVTTIAKFNASTGALLGTFSIGASSPQGMAYDTFTNSIWVANNASGSVSKFSTSTGSVTGAYGAGASPRAMVLDSYTNSMWIANYSSNNVSKLNAVTGAVIGTYAVGTNPGAITFDSHTNSIWVANFNSGNVKKLSVVDGSTTGTYATGTGPSGVVFDPSTNSVWVTNYNSSNVVKLNSETGAVVGTYALGFNPSAIAFDSNSNFIWIASNNSTNLRKINPVDGSIVGTYAGAGNVKGMTFDSHTNSLWLAYIMVNVGKINAETGEIVGTYPANAYPMSVTFDPVTNSIWVSDEWTNSVVTKIDSNTGSKVATYYVGTTPTFGVKFDSFTNSVWVANAASGSVSKIRVADISYDTTGVYTSGVIDLGLKASDFTVADFSASLPSNTSLSIAIRAGDNSDTGHASWTDWLSNVADGGSLSSLGAHRYVQYRASLATADGIFTPALEDISIAYNAYPSAQSLLSSAYDSTDTGNVIGAVGFDEDATLPAGTGVVFSVRTAADEAGLSAAAWSDFTNNSLNCAKVGTRVSCPVAAIPSALKTGGDDRWWQYKVTLSSGGSLTPTLSGVEVKYVVNAPPEIQNVTASQGSDGKVAISYEVRDIDTLAGSNTPGEISPTFEYWNGSAWSTCTTLSAGATANKDVDDTDFNTYTLTWDSKTDYNNHYLTDAKIRVKANDNEGANNLSSAESAAFTIDTVDPLVDSFVADARSDAENNLAISVSEDTTANLKMKISNRSDLAADGQNASSGTWIDYATAKSWTFANDNPTVYYQFKDQYGNISHGGEIHAVVLPTRPPNILYQDVSNVETSEWREFIAWGKVPEPTSGFKQYNIYRSIDGVAFALLGAPQTDRSTNFILDAELDTDTTYYYRVAAEDDAGNISFYSEIISDRPDGQGGTDLTPPVISNIVISNVTAQSALITWETDEPSNSTVSYITNDSGDFTDAPGVAVASMLDNENRLGKHSVFLNNLSPGLIYYIQVASADPNTNVSTGGVGMSFEVLSGPVISNVTTSNINNAGAIVSWNTSDNGDSHVYYSTDSAFTDPAEAALGNSATSHAVTLSGLLSGTTYYYYVTSGVAEDKNIIDGEAVYYSFTTTSDILPPTIIFDADTDISDKTETSARIAWITSELATSTIEYSQDESYGSSQSNANLNTNHSFDLTGLSRGTLYNFRLKSTDANGNSTTSDSFNFVTEDLSDTTPPNIIFDEEAGISNKTDTAVRISWSTNELASSSIEYSVDDSYEESLSNANFNINHSFELTGLSQGTTYNFRLKNTDAGANATTSSSYSFTTDDYSDESAPIVSNVSAQQVADTSAVITWTTNEAANSTVEYGLAAGVYTASSTKASYDYSHSVILSNLNALTKYYFRVSSADESANATSSLEFDFTTQDTLVSGATSTTVFVGGGGSVTVIDKADKVAPVISEPVIGELSSSQAIISWTTDESANSIVEFGTDEQYGLASVNLAYTTSHQQKLLNLFPSTIYYYKISSTDSSGNLANPKTGTFNTPAFNPDELDINNPDNASADKEQAENSFASILERTFTFLKQAAKTVSTAFLESSLIEQQNSIKELAGLAPAPQVVSGPTVKVWEDMAIVTWQTDKKTSSLVASSEDGVSLNDAVRTQVIGSPEVYSTDHQVILAGLKSDTTYNYQIKGSTVIGSSLKFEPRSFTTLSKAAKVDNYVADRLTDESASFKWSSSLPTNTAVRITPYRNNALSYDEARVISDNKLTSIHEVTVDNLEPGVFYKIDLFGKDKSGKTLNQTIEAFSTVNQELPFMIEQVKTNSALATGQGTQVQSIISWLTTKLSTSKVYYRQGTSKDDNYWPLESNLDSGYTRQHLVVMTDFNPGEVYQFQVESTDSNGQTVRSKTYTILTPRQKESVFQVILKNIEQTFGWMGGGE